MAQKRIETVFSRTKRIYLNKNFNTVEELADTIDAYINWEDEKKGGYDANGVGKGIYTIEACALYCGFYSIEGFRNQKKRGEEWEALIGRFMLFLTDWNVKKLYWAGCIGGAKFWLTNHGNYSEEVVQHQKQEITQVTITEKKRDD